MRRIRLPRSDSSVRSTRNIQDLRKTRKIRDLILAVVIPLAAVLLALLAAEAVARQRYPDLRKDAMRQSRPEDLFMRFDPHLGWANIPGRTVRFRRTEFDTQVTINADGFRGPQIPRERTPGRYRIVLLGDSFAFGHGVEDEETSAQALARDLPNTEVVNLGVTGYSTDQELLQLRESGLGWNPDLVVLYLCPNDLLDNGREIAWGLYWKPCFLLDGDSLRLQRETLPSSIPLNIRLQRALYQHFVLYNVVAWRFARLSQGPHFGAMHFGDAGAPAESGRSSGKAAGQAAGQATGHATAQAGQPGAGELTDAGRLTRHLIAEMIRTSNARGAQFLLVVLPSFGEPAALEGLPATGSGARLDLDQVFAAYRSAHPDSAVGYSSDGHWNARGHRVVADAIARMVRERAWWPR